MPTDSAHFHLLGQNYRCRLYLADDHLLAVIPEGVIWEKYLRLRYADMCAISLQKRPHRHYAIAGSLLVTLAGALLIMAVDRTLAAVLLLPALALAAILLKFCLDQPDCRMTIHTLTHAHPLLFPHTLRQARRLLPLLRERLQQAQPSSTNSTVFAPSAAGVPRHPPEIACRASIPAVRTSSLPFLFFLSIPVCLPVNLTSDNLLLALLALLPSCYLGIGLVLAANRQTRPVYALICLLTVLQILQLPGIFALSDNGTEYLQLAVSIMAPNSLFPLHRLIVYMQTFLPFVATPPAIAGILILCRQRQPKPEASKP